MRTLALIAAVAAALTPATVFPAVMDRICRTVAHYQFEATAGTATGLTARRALRISDGSARAFDVPVDAGSGGADVVGVQARNADASRVIATGTIAGRTLADRFAESVNVRDFGAKGDGITDDTGALRAAAHAADAGAKALYLPSGTYVTEKLTEFSAAGVIIRGDGPMRSILKSRSGDTVIEITGRSIHTIAIQDVAIHGAGEGTGSGHGLFIHHNRFPPHLIRLENVRVMYLGGHGIFLTEGFSLVFETVVVSHTGDDAIELLADVGATFTNVYVGKIAANKYGWHVYAGRPVFVGCNGIDGTSGAGASWGRFGRNLAKDGARSASYPTFIGTNFEDFRKYGVHFVSGSSGNFYGATFYAPTRNPTPVEAIRYESAGVIPIAFGVFDSTSEIVTRGALWANGFAIHAEMTTPPLLVNAPSPEQAWRDDARSAVKLSKFYKAPNGTIVLDGPVAVGTPANTGFGLSAPDLLVHEPLASNDTDRQLALMQAGTDATLGPMRLAVGVRPSPNGSNRSAFIDSGDTGGARELKLNPAGGAVRIGGMLLVKSSPPPSSSAPGEPGMMTWDSGYFYVCVAKNTWKRASLSSW